MKLISIVIPVYNVDKYIDECVSSVFESTSIMDDIEIILIDDGSTDDSGYKCDEYAKRYKDFVIVIHQSNGGLSNARNTGIKNASGLYVALLDSDDKLAIDALDNLRNILHTHTPDIVINRVDKFVDGTDCYKRYNFCHANEIEMTDHLSVYKQLLYDRHFTFTAWTFVVSRTFLLENSIEFYEGILHEDELWTYEIFLNCNSIYINESAYYLYRTNRPNSIMAVKGIKHLVDYGIILEKLVNQISTYDDLRFIYLTYVKAADIYWSLLFNSKDYLGTEYEKELICILSRYSYLLRKCKDKRAIYIFVFNKLFGCKAMLKMIRKLKYLYGEKNASSFTW